MDKLKIVDKYITKQLVETFLLGIVVFTSIMFASDTFLTLVKQISAYGIQLKIAFMIIVLKLPSILVLTIPMGVLLSTILTFNKLSTNSEIAVMRACGISIMRLAMPVIVFGSIAAFTSFIINEYIVPTSNVQARNLTIWALSQKHIPEGKTNFSFREMDNSNELKRLFYIDHYTDKKMRGITVLDLSKKGAIQIVQSKYGTTDPEFWSFDNGVIYTISGSGSILNTTVFDNMKLYNNFNMFGKASDRKAKELNFISLAKYISYQKRHHINVAKLTIQLQEKFAIPITSLLIALIGVPLAITPPRARFNRGFIFSILVLFCYYLIRAFSVSLGQAEIINPVVAAWLPNIVIAITGSILLYRKAYLV